MTALRHAAAHLDTQTTAELHTRPQGAAARTQTARLRLPVFLANGQRDSHYCATNEAAHIRDRCTNQRQFHTWARRFLPHARLSTHLIPHTGHAIEWERTAPTVNQRLLDWVR